MFNAVRNESAGEWYLGVYCRKCRAPIPVFHDPGRGIAAAHGTGKLTVACPRCGKKAHYAAFEMTAFLVHADRAAVAVDHSAVNDDQPVDREAPPSSIGKAEIDAEDDDESESVLDLAPYEIPEYEIPEFEPEPALELETPEPEIGAVLELEEEAVLELDEDIAPELEADTALAPEFEPEPLESSSSSVVEPAPAIELAFQAETPEITGPEITGPEIAGPQNVETARDGTPVAEPELEAAPAPEATPRPASEPEPALELEAFFEARPEPAPADESLKALFDSLPIAESAPTVEVPAPEPEPVGPTVDDSLEAFFESQPVPEAAPAVEPPAPEPEPAAPPTPVTETFAESLEAFFESQPVPEPPPAIDGPAPVVETAAPTADESLEAFFESQPVPEPAAPPAPVIETADESLEAFFESRPIPEPPPTVEAPASEWVPPPEPVAPPPPPPPVPPSPTTRAPKPISQIYRERWAEPALRPRVVVELRPILGGLKRRAEAERDDIVVRVADLFLDYLDAVAPAHQSAAAIEQYINAVFTLAGRQRSPGTDRVGEQIAASLRALNRHAGLYTGR